MTATTQSGRPPVEHRFFGLDRRTILPALGVLAFAIFWSGVIPGIDEAITADEIEDGTVFELANNVSFIPTPGWVVDGVPAPGSSVLSVFDEGVQFEIRVGQFVGTPDELMDEILDTRNEVEAVGDRQSFTNPQGIPGVGVETHGARDDGALFAMTAVGPNADPEVEEATILVGGDFPAIEVTVEGPPGALNDRTDAIAAMVASITVDFASTDETDEEGDS